jgi:BolA protein
MTMKERIETRLRERLGPELLEVANESGMHATPPGAESHFRVLVVSGAFDGRSPIERHRLVYDALGDDMRSLHALAITARTPAEHDRAPGVPASPACLGGSKVAS